MGCFRKPFWRIESLSVSNLKVKKVLQWKLHWLSEAFEITYNLKYHQIQMVNVHTHSFLIYFNKKTVAWSTNLLNEILAETPRFLSV